MSGFINGVPIDFNEEDDSRLFRSLFSFGQLTGTSFPTPPVPPFADKYISANDLSEEEGLKRYSLNNLIIYYSKDKLVPQYLNTVVVTGKLEPTVEKTYSAIKLRIFIHTDGTKIQKYNKVVRAEPDEIILLIEANDKGNRYGSVMYVQIGYAVERSKLPLLELYADISGAKANISFKEFKNLLQPNILSYTKVLLGNIINITYSSYGSVKALSKLAELAGLFSKNLLAEGIRTLKISEQVWNPEADGYTQKYFTHGSYLEVSKKVKLAIPGGHHIKHVLRLAINELEAAGKEAVNQLKGLDNKSPERIKKYIKPYINEIQLWISKTVTLVYESADLIALALSQKGFEFANGLLCGFFNGIIEGIAGIFEFLGMLFNLSSSLYKATEEITEMYLFIREMLENLIEAFDSKMLAELFMMIVKAPITLVQSILEIDKEVLLQKLESISIARAGYNIGYIAGTIIEMLLEILVTGGTAAVVKTVLTVRKSTTTAGKMARTFSKSIAGEISSRLSNILLSIKNNTAKAELQKWIDELILEIRKALGLVDEVADDAAKKADDLQLEKLNLAKKMWDEFDYDELLRTPPTKQPCFLAGTPVSTINGLVPIEQIEIGNLLHGYDFKSETSVLKPVTELFKNFTEKYVKLYTPEGFIEATGGHRFWIPQVKQWVNANQLELGMQFENIKGSLVPLIKTEIVEQVVPTYNLEVADVHNYFVGTDQILSHNKTLKESIFNNTETIDVRFYKINGAKDQAMYVGQTIQETATRYLQHTRDPKKASWVNKMRGFSEIDINDLPGPFKMTPYEAAVTEMYQINYYKGTTQSVEEFKNKSKPISKKKFEYFKKNGSFNPCKFFV